ncbi:ATP-binding cassette domain-containing protein [Thiohalocapsa marina]|uniref:ATP-binding cassette domain-containing protein n=1 Tax=Thiohalocapsa marina TaxID=424902 RepID=A0A5M8FS35_9GAMM|nr:ATP-binding cassette domain-containing protein [Thiohalocapsa marina]KAA6186751.1 ATP-binding cassette domain-containing protein [Thiohalocapsa marina]
MSNPAKDAKPGHATEAGTVTSGSLIKLLGAPDLRKVLPALIASALVSNVLVLALPLAILQILDRVIVNQALSTLGFLAIGLFAALILEQLLRVINGMLTSWLGARFEHRATIQALDHLFRVPLRRYQRNEPSVYAEMIQAASRVSGFYSGQALLGLLDLPFVFLFLGLIYLIGGALVLVPVTLLLLFTLLMMRHGRARQGLVQGRAGIEDRRTGFLYELLSGIHTVKTMMMERSMLRRYEMLQRASAEEEEHSTTLSDRADRLGHYFSQLMVICIISVGAWMVIQGDMTSGGLAASLILSVRLMRPLRQGLQFKHRYQEFISANQRLRELMALPVVDEPGKPPLPPIERGIELRDVEVRFTDQPLFSGVNLTVPKGAYIAIRGASGCGKTTLLNVIRGLEQADAGELLVDDRPLSDFAASSCFRRIALLPEAGIVVSGTILENLTMFDASLNRRALELASELGLDAVVAGMKLGYETRLGENASETLSMGFRQLISIVRALVRDPDVILFDEANMALDMDRDRDLRRYLEQQKGRCSLILVSHRPSYLALADRNYYLHDGRLHDTAPEQPLADQEPAQAPPRPETDGHLARLIEERLTHPTDLSRCLQPLLYALDWQGQTQDLAEALPHMDIELDLSGLFAVLSELEYAVHPLGAMRKPPDDRLAPYLYLPRRGPAQVVIERTLEGQLRVFDGGSGEQMLVDRLSGAGTFYVFKPAPARDTPDSKTSWVTGVLHRFRAHQRLILLITVLTTILSLAPPLYTRTTWDRVIPVGDIQIELYLFVGALIAVAIGWILSMVKGRMLGHVGGRAEYIIGIGLTRRILGLRSVSIEGVPVTRQVRRLRGLHRLREYFVGPIARLAFDLPATLILVAVLVLINPWMSIVLLASVSAFALAGFFVFRASKRPSQAASVASAARREFIDETLHALRLIRESGAEPAWTERLRTLSAEAVLSGFRSRRLTQQVQGLSRVLAGGTGVLTLITSAFLAIKGEISNGTLLATQILIWRITGPMQNLFLASTSATRIKENIRQIDNLMRLPLERDRGIHQTIRPAVQGQVNLERVSFRYSNDSDPALLGVTCEIASRQFLAITGPDGAGKSTLLHLILKMYLPQAGSIRLDNIDIRQLTTTDLRSRISYMPQSCDLFYGTITQNLRLAHPAASNDEIRWAADMSGLLADIEDLPEGFETRISSSRALQLPRGFRQRLSLARTMLRPAPLVLMDEPGTGMDTAGDLALERCIRWLMGRTTLIVVTLRPGHMRLADRVLYLEKGRVTAIGPFDQLEAKIMAGLR